MAVAALSIAVAEAHLLLLMLQFAATYEHFYHCLARSTWLASGEALVLVSCRLWLAVQLLMLQLASCHNSRIIISNLRNVHAPCKHCAAWTGCA
jgi:hypothetical protein